MDQLLVFDLWGQYAHYKKIFATTTALTYPIPVKTALYGMFGAMLGLEKQDNQYLKFFQPGQCKVGIQILNPITYQKININLRSVFGPMKPNDNRKPTMVEFIYRPYYRIFFTHSDRQVYENMRTCLFSKQVVFTPTLGLANLLANYEWVGEYPFKPILSGGHLPVATVIPRRQLIQIDHSQAFSRTGSRIMEIAQYALEMDPSRDVTDRDDIIFDQNGNALSAITKTPFEVELHGKHVIITLF